MKIGAVFVLLLMLCNFSLLFAGDDSGLVLADFSAVQVGERQIDFSMTFSGEDMTRGPETSKCEIDVGDNLLAISFVFSGMDGGIASVDVGVIVEDKDGFIVGQFVADITNGPFSHKMFGYEQGVFITVIPLRRKLERGDTVRVSIRVTDKQGQKAAIIYKGLPFVEKIPI